MQFFRLPVPKNNLVRQFSLNVGEFQKKNYYDSLGLTPKATQGDIKSAYYKLSKECHPDKNKNSETAAEKFRDITAAYEVLGNVKSRKLYDRGLLVHGNGIGLGHQEEEQVVENYEHAPFYHSRNKPVRKKASTGQTDHYNIDEWTRAHYSKTFNKAHAWKETGERNIRYDKENAESQKSSIHVIAFVTVIMVSYLMFRTNPVGRYDIDNPEEKSE